MLTAETLHAEGARYAAQVVCVPGLWAGPAVWRAFGGYLGHRGWECHLLDLRGVGGGVAARAAAVAEYVAALPSPAVLLGHDAGAVVALAAAARGATVALVLLAPLYPGSRGTRRLTLTPRNLLPLLVGGRVPPPARAAGPGWLDLPEPGRSRLAADLAPDDAATVWDLAWGRRALPRAAGVPALVIAGEHDPLLPPDAAASLARAAGAELRVLAGAGHWPFAGPSWQATVALVHRWLVQRLGAPLLELYAEAMAERGTDDEGVE